MLHLLSTPEINNNAILLLRIVWWGIVCFFTGRSVGNTVDIQYREKEGKPQFIKIAQQNKSLFRFKYIGGTEVVREGLITQILGYIFSIIETILLILAIIVRDFQRLALIADWLVILFAAIVTFVVLLPMHFKYQHYIRVAYDCDWITQFQEAFTLYPKRRCRIISEIDSSTYEIMLSRWGKKRLAKADIPVTVGAVMFAVHSNEQGFPFWTIKNH